MCIRMANALAEMEQRVRRRKKKKWPLEWNFCERKSVMKEAKNETLISTTFQASYSLYTIRRILFETEIQQNSPILLSYKH